MFPMRLHLKRPGPYLIAVLALILRVLPTPRTIDDAYITFRYARNLLDGAGFVYNPGERVLGTTTPLYTVLMATASRLSGLQDYAWLAVFVNALADAATCVLLAMLGEQLSGRRAVGLAASLLWAVAPMSVTFAIGGMETSVFIFLLILCVTCYMFYHARLALFTAGLVLLTRPDGALLVGPMILSLVWRRWHSRLWPWREAGLFVLALAPWTIFATLYFGSPVPHSITAKALAYRLPPEAALVRLLQHYGTPFFEHLWLGRFWPLIGFALYAALSAMGSLAALRRDSRAWPLVIFPWLYFAAFAIANPLIFRWYLAPPLPVYFLLIVSGLAKLADDVKRQMADGRWPRLPFILLLPVAFFLLASLNAWTLRPDHGPDRPAPEMAWHKLELLYEQVGRELAPRVNAETMIAAGDVGALGYFSNARILDTVGLMSPEASAYYPLDPALYVINYAIAPQLIHDKQPDYVVLLEVYGRNGLLIDPRFAGEYTLVEQVPTDIYGSKGLLVYVRRTPAGDPGQ
jgi:hypothetical protein